MTTTPTYRTSLSHYYFQDKERTKNCWDVFRNSDNRCVWTANSEAEALEAIEKLKLGTLAENLEL